MVNKENFDDKMMELIELMDEEKQKRRILGENEMTLIEEIADYAENTELFKSAYNGELDDMTANKIWVYLINKIVYAPTYFHMVGSCILIMPIFRRKIKEERNLL